MKDYSKDYLLGKFGAIHVIKHIIDWDEVHKEFEKGKEVLGNASKEDSIMPGNVRVV